jgi:GT2 family glycosyltransferase
VTSVGCVVLSQGSRPAELRRALEAVMGQRDVPVAAVVVGNGWMPEGLPDGVTSVALEDNRGIPEGRNIGASSVDGDVLLFLDDDIDLVGPDFLSRAVAQFERDPALAVLQPRSVDPGGSPTARRHVPRPGAADPTRSGDVAWFWEGASLIRRSAFDEIGGWPGHFFYGHEGIEVAWRMIDAGYRIRYDADLEVLNPEAAPFRGPHHSYLNARNRVWVARRNLPSPLLAAYLLVWVLATFARARSGAEMKAAGRGFWDGARTPCGPRRPIKWATAWRLTKLGRPPVL